MYNFFKHMAQFSESQGSCLLIHSLGTESEDTTQTSKTNKSAPVNALGISGLEAPADLDVKGASSSSGTSSALDAKTKATKKKYKKAKIASTSHVENRLSEDESTEALADASSSLDESELGSPETAPLPASFSSKELTNIQSELVNLEFAGTTNEDASDWTTVRPKSNPRRGRSSQQGSVECSQKGPTQQISPRNSVNFPYLFLL
jgi:hypothetical protein